MYVYTHIYISINSVFKFMQQNSHMEPDFEDVSPNVGERAGVLFD